MKKGGFLLDEPIAPLLLMAGKILFQLQQLENVVKTCYAFLNVDDIHLTIDDLFSEDSKKRHYTLGQLLKATKRPRIQSVFRRSYGFFYQVPECFYPQLLDTK